MKKVSTIDEYIKAFPKDVQVILEKVRKTIHEAAPEATEAISYGLATFKLNGNLVHFGAYKEHIGFYPAPNGIEAFKDELGKYQTGKGTLQFPINEPIPYDIITKVVKYRVKQNVEKKK